MTTATVSRGPARPADGTPSRARPRRLWPHAALLAVVLFALLPVLDNGSVGNADEGAVLAQAQVLAAGHGWGMTYPAARIDPTGRWFPLDLTVQIGGRWYPYTKHTVYPELVSLLYRWDGLGGVLAAHVLGVVLTALLAGLLARRIRPAPTPFSTGVASPAAGAFGGAGALGGGGLPDRIVAHLDVITLWVVGLGSPIFFDGYWVIAHSLACVGALAALLGALRALDGHRVDGAVVMAAGLAEVVLFRSEGTLFGIALALALAGLWAWPTGRRHRAAPGLAGIALAVTAAGYLGSAALERRAEGGSAAVPFHLQDSAGFVSGRVTGFWHTVLDPQMGGVALGALCCVLAALLAAVAWGYLRVRPAELTIIRGASLGAAALLVLRLLLPAAPVPGILVACPLLLVGLVSVRRTDLRPTPARLVALTAALFAAAVFATQYGIGGSGDWGGRYLHLALPAVVPVALMVVARALGTVDRRLASTLAAALLAMTLALTVLAGATMWRLHDVTGVAVEGVHAVALTTPEAREPGGPVVVTTEASFGRFSWRYVTGARYLTVTDLHQLPDLAASLDRAGVGHFVFAGSAAMVHKRLASLEGRYVVERTHRIASVDWTVVVLRHV